MNRTNEAMRFPSRRHGTTALAALFAAALIGSFGSAQKAYVTNTSAGTVSVIDATSLTVVATIPVGASPGRLAVVPDGARILVANSGSDTLSVLDATTDAVVATIAVGDGPSSLAVTPNGARVYVGGTNGLVSVVDTALGGVIHTVSAGAPASGGVNGLAVSPDGSKVYALWGNLVVIDTASDTVVNSIYAGNYPTSLALSPDGARIYVPVSFGLGAFSFYGSVTVVDAATESVASSIFIWSLPSSIAVSPDGARAYVSTPSTFVDTGYGQGFLPSPWVAHLDLASNSLGGGINASSPGSGVAITPDGSRVYVAVPSGNRVAVIDTATNTILATVTVGTSPTGVVIAPAGSNTAGAKKSNWSGSKRL